MKPKVLPGLAGYVAVRVRPDGTHRRVTIKLPKDINPDIGIKSPKPKG